MFSSGGWLSDCCPYLWLLWPNTNGQNHLPPTPSTPLLLTYDEFKDSVMNNSVLEKWDKPIFATPTYADIPRLVFKIEVLDFDDNSILDPNVRSWSQAQQLREVYLALSKVAGHPTDDLSVVQAQFDEMVRPDDESGDLAARFKTFLEHEETRVNALHTSPGASASEGACVDKGAHKTEWPGAPAVAKLLTQSILAPAVLQLKKNFATRDVRFRDVRSSWHIQVNALRDGGVRVEHTKWEQSWRPLHEASVSLDDEADVKHAAFRFQWSLALTLSPSSGAGQSVQSERSDSLPGSSVDSQPRMFTLTQSKLRIRVLEMHPEADGSLCQALTFLARSFDDADDTTSSSPTSSQNSYGSQGAQS